MPVRRHRTGAAGSCRRDGADVRFDVGRAALRTTTRGVEVDVGGETISAPVAVVTAGAWVREVLGESGDSARRP